MGTFYKYSVNCIWLKRIPIHQITSNLGFIIPFNLYIHEHDLDIATYMIHRHDAVADDKDTIMQMYIRSGDWHLRIASMKEGPSDLISQHLVDVLCLPNPVKAMFQ